MSSTMTVMPSKHDQKGLFGGAKSVPVWLQFVPGIVDDVITGREHNKYVNKVRKQLHLYQNL